MTVKSRKNEYFERSNVTNLSPGIKSSKVTNKNKFYSKNNMDLRKSYVVYTKTTT